MGVAALIKDRLIADAETQPSPSPKPTVVKRSAVRLRERERALAELRDRFYESTTIDDSVLDFPHGPQNTYSRIETEQAGATSTATPSASLSVSEAPKPAYPAYFNYAVSKKKM